MFSISILQTEAIPWNEQQGFLQTDKYCSHFIIGLCRSHECRPTGFPGDVGLGTIVEPRVIWLLRPGAISYFSDFAVFNLLSYFIWRVLNSWLGVLRDEVSMLLERDWGVGCLYLKYYIRTYSASHLSTWVKMYNIGLYWKHRGRATDSFSPYSHCVSRIWDFRQVDMQSRWKSIAPSVQLRMFWTWCQVSSN